MCNVHVFFSDEQVRCPRCGTRTEFEDSDADIQHHACLNKWYCGYEFDVEFEQEEE